MENPLAVPTPPAEEPVPGPARADDLTGRLLGDFQLVRRIGQGGMGQVYLARQVSLNRQVAVKILRTDLAANETSLRRFEQEAKAVAAVTHANIVQVYSIGQADGLHYMALEYVEGRNLRDYLGRKGPPETPVALSIMRQVAAALQRASELGFVHRDIKPENILLTRKGEVKVADFGLSRCFAAEQPLNITQSGVSMGTPLYMSPEQVQGHTVDPRSDIYSFGVTCYHLLAGEPPFKGETPFEVAIQHVQNEPRPLQEVRPDLPAELCAAVHKMMAKKPEARFQTAREVLRELTRLKDGVAATLTQGGATPTATLKSSGLTPIPLATDTVPVTPPPRRWRRWVLGVLLALAAGAAGAAAHWKFNRAKEPAAADVEEFAGDRLPDPARTQEKELLKRLHGRHGKPDLEGTTNALLDLALLYAHEKRWKEAMQLFDADALRKLPVVTEASAKFKTPAQYLGLVSALGKGIVLAHEDLPEKSVAEFKAVMPQASLPKKALGRQPLDEFLWKFDRWKKAVADALDRDAKNLGTRLEEPLQRYRSYSKAP
jgi:tRNA A-37 threonylcarbamoyl transferase component Bud32